MSRCEAALQQRRYQTAVDLAQALYQETSNDRHLYLLVGATLGRAGQLFMEAKFDEAVNVILPLIHHPLSPEQRDLVSRNLACCGDLDNALLLCEEPDHEKHRQLLSHFLDHAVQRGVEGGSLVPEEYREQFDCIHQASGLIEKGKDEEGFAILKNIGIRSPFLDWKLMLRGLSAYYQKDDSRAIENWSRLDETRLPVRVIAPFRFQIDQEFCDAQSPPAQQFLHRKAARLTTTPLVDRLIRIQNAIHDEEHTLRQILTLVRESMPTIQAEAPQIVPRLASYFYWAILEFEDPSALYLYRKIFQPPPDDPTFDRLHVLGYERFGSWSESHEHWKAFASEIKSHPKQWPGELGKHALALVWRHMGLNALSASESIELDMLPPALRSHRKPVSLKPNAVECFTRSLKLNPENVEVYQDLLMYYQDKGDHKNALPVAQAFVDHAPEVIEAHTHLGELLLLNHEPAESLASFQNALKLNPLDKMLRDHVATAHLHLARDHAENGQFEEARASYQASLSMSSGRAWSVYCKWAACEIKAGEESRGEELLQKALEDHGNELAVTYNMLVETIRLKLPTSYKKRFNDQFNEKLKEPATSVAVCSLLATTAIHERAGIDYVGRKTHRKKSLDYFREAIKKRGITFTEEQLRSMCVSLLDLKEYKRTKECTDLGSDSYPESPFFPFFRAENELNQGKGSYGRYRAHFQLEQAERLATALPDDPEIDELLKQIRLRKQLLAAMNPIGNVFESFFDNFGSEDFF